MRRERVPIACHSNSFFPFEIYIYKASQFPIRLRENIQFNTKQGGYKVYMYML